MALAIPGSRGCFSFLQNALSSPSEQINITNEIRDQLQDFLWLAKDITSRPTHLAEIVPTPPTYFGAMDASKSGMGGVWFPPDLQLSGAVLPHSSHRLDAPTLWRYKFPSTLQSKLVSLDNPSGTITNSDLELAGTVAHDDILSSLVPVSRLTLSSFSDNTAAIAWRTKGSTTTSGPAAYLLQIASLHQRHHRYQSSVHYIAGPANVMADDCSRLWNFTDKELITYFNFHYPQKKSWKMHHLQPAMAALISALLKNGQSRRRTFARLKAERTWKIWCAFCESINANPDLSTMADPIPLLQTFGLRWRDGRISPSGKPNRARSVEDAIRLVSQKFSLLGLTCS